jgi:hypothetical protein
MQPEIVSGFSITNKAGMPLLWFGYTSNADAAAARELIITALESAKFVGQGRQV